MTQTFSTALLQQYLENAVRTAGKDAYDRALSNVLTLSKKYEIGIITALPIETTAIQEAFGNAVRIPSILRNAVDFYEITVVAKNGKNQKKKTILLAQCIRMGNNSAAVAATAMLAAFPSISDILMVGIAGGVPNTADSTARAANAEDHVRKGDIVVGEQVIQYDMLKLEIDKNENRSRMPQPSAKLLNAVNRLRLEELQSRYPWEKIIVSTSAKLKWSRPTKDLIFNFKIGPRGSIQKSQIRHPRQRGRRPNRPIVHLANIGSANILLKDSTLREKLRVRHKIRAVEMEGSGIADAAWTFNSGYLVIRGICDYCDMDKDNKWQRYAAVSAAGYAKLVVEYALSE